MKTLKYLILCAATAVSLTAPAQDNKILDAQATSLKVNELNQRKAKLQKEIQVEDKKRNQTLRDVTAETQELINTKQDSICLELRSRLVSVELELRELIPDKTAEILTDRLEALNQNQK